MRKTFLLMVLSVCFSSVTPHSWLACVDYTEKNAKEYDHARCRGYARNARTLAPNGGKFGQDRGVPFVVDYLTNRSSRIDFKGNARSARDSRDNIFS